MANMTQGQWDKLSKLQHMHSIGDEIKYASAWQERNKEVFVESLERVLVLIDLSINDPKWKSDILQLLVLREEVAKFYCGQRAENITELHRVL
jgi:hypothetical protein